MQKKLGRQTVRFEKDIIITGSFSSVGKKESEGPLGKYFHKVYTDEKMNQTSFEKAESELLKSTVLGAMSDCAEQFENIDYIFSGDLLNQCISTTFAIKDFGIPFFGIFGACSTMCEGLSLGAMAIDGNFAKKVVAVTSSHFCSAERQFRFPLEYGGARTPTAQWTVTGSGAAVLSDEGEGPVITHITTGKIVDMGIKDANNMGAAMAPAAADVIKTHLLETKRDPSYYDLIVTGDLGKVGMDINVDLLKKHSFDIQNNYRDCGDMIFDAKKQNTKSGGSGCGCCGSVFCGYFMKMLKKKNINRLLLVATGALMSPTSAGQGLTIPGIAHAVAIENKE